MAKPVLFGEVMFRFAPLDQHTKEDHPLGRDDEPHTILRSLAGDELNVAVALSRLGFSSSYVSVLPGGPLGEIVFNGASAAGVDVREVQISNVPGAEIGTFTVFPEKKTVHYQRKNSSFAVHNPDIFDWDRLLNPEKCSWLHITGITPLISAACAESWRRSVGAALKKGINVSMDFNHRKQLGTLEELWEIASPFMSQLYIVIFSTLNLRELAIREGLPAPAPATPLDDESWVKTMVNLREKLELKRIACCFKLRADDGVQRRWSVIVDESGPHSSFQQPVFHAPKDEIGGGSAWAAGLLLAIHENLTVSQTLHRADILAALCQETAGDWSDATRTDLNAVEKATGGGGVHIPLKRRREETLALMERAGVVSIIRASNPDIAIARGIELAQLGAKCIEVTMDSVDWLRVLRQISANVPADVVLGVGTVMDTSIHLLKDAVAAGARFALSPINPPGFLAECQRLDIVSAPSAFTSNEIFAAHRQGASVIKLFPASLFTAANLKALKAIGDFGSVRFMPSGGVGPDACQEWWSAGALVIGLGSNLVGKDLSAKDSELKAAQDDWDKSGRAKAQALYHTCALRYAH